MGPARTDSTELPAPAVRLLDVAVELFFTQGYDATAVNDIVAAAGVTKGAFYHYYSSKEEVLRLVHERVIDRQIERLITITDGDASRSEKLARVLHEALANLRENQRQMSVFLRERRALTPEGRAVITEKRDRWQQLFVDLIIDGAEHGEFRIVGDPKVIAFGIIGMRTWATEWFDPAGPATLDEIADWYYQLVLNGLSASTPSSVGITQPA